MLFDRQPRRILLWSSVLTIVAVGAGCHSTMLQPVATPPSSKTADDQNPVAATSSAASPKNAAESAERTQLTQVPLPVVAPVVPASLPTSAVAPQPLAVSPARIDVSDPQVVKASTSAPALALAENVSVADDPALSLPPAQSTSSATPMLDAALRRAEQLQRQTVKEAMANEQETRVPAPPEPKPAPRVDKPVSPPMAAAPKSQQRPTKPQVAVSPAKVVEKAESKPSMAALEAPPQPTAKIDPKVRKVEAEKKEPSPPAGPETLTIGALPATQAVQISNSLEITDARLCRRVLSFGSVDPLTTKTLKPGQVVVLYAELTGVNYDHHADQFRSRTASKLELIPGSGQGGNPVWVETPPVVQDVCQHRRRDFYLNYLIPVPKGVEPGDYSLRLSVTDLVSNRSATYQVPLTIAR